MSALLSIIIPTYNRATFLGPLLALLEAEVKGRESLVEVIIGDNASTDDTESVAKVAVERCQAFRLIRHPENVGPEENFCKCLDVCDARYVWIMGDDDLPMPGVLGGLLTLLQNEQPDLVCMKSTWHKDIHAVAGKFPSVTAFQWQALSREVFAERVNIWFTFISGIVFNYAANRGTLNRMAIRRFSGTSLVQLGWVLPILQSGTRFLLVETPCVLATSGNTGGYAVIKTFCGNFVRIVNEVLGSTQGVARLILRRHYIQYLPGLIWNVRFGSSGKFSVENHWEGIDPSLRRTMVFWVLLAPILSFRKPFALLFYCVARAVSVCQRVGDS